MLWVYLSPELFCNETSWTPTLFLFKKLDNVFMLITMGVFKEFVGSNPQK